MPSILVVEQEDRYVERIRAALSAEGWKVRIVPGADQAIQAAASEAPDLVLVSAEVPAAATLAGAFSRNGGGPGVVGLLAEGTAFPAPGFAPDDLLAKPFTDEALRTAAHKALGSRRPPSPASPADAPASRDHKLTSHEIFGDVLDEVEGPRSPAPPAPAGPPPLLTAAAASAARPAPPVSPPAPDDEMKRRLEKTLSGMLNPERLTSDKPRPAAPAPPAPKRSEADNIDALLSRTLSNMDLGKTKTGVRPPPAPAPPQPAAAPPPRPVRPAAPAVPAAPPAPAAAAAPAAESTAVRKARTTGAFDFSELEELARSGRTPAPVVPPRATAPPAPVPSRPSPPSPPPLPPASAVRPPAAVAPPPPPTAAPAPPVIAAPAPPPVQPPAAAATPRPAASAVSLAADSAATQRIPVFADEPVEGERFGQYTLLERIAAGGMAEVWKARMRGVEGFQKTVAIKRILPHMTDNAEFVGMFIDEAKLAAQLSHPNIVHIFDLGKIGRDYYIAMEYVEGKDLRSLLNAGRHKGLYLPLSLCLLIASRVANALDYAHRKRDFENRELGLVHRDVSPQNVLLTYDGDVKLCDFGIAKAVSKASQTLMGALKGKLQYMSPEQAWGRPVDARSDLFSLGSVLFEMLTGERLFPGDSEISVLESVRQGKVRSPRQVNPAIPKEVDDIVVRALAVAPQARFQSAGEMKQKLEAALANLGSSAGSAELADYIHRALEPGDPAPAGRVTETALPIPAPLPVSWPPEPALSAPAAPIAPVAAELPPLSPETEAPIEPVAAVGAVAMGEEGGRKSRTFLYLAIAALVVVAVATFWFLNRRRGEAPSAPPVTGSATQAPGAVPNGSPAPAGTPQVAATPGGVNVQALVDKQLAQKEEDMRKKLELQQKDLEKQIAAAKAAGKPLPATPAQTAGVPAPSTPAPAVRPPAPEPAAPAVAPQPEPAKTQEKAPEKVAEKAPPPAAEPPKPRTPEPAPAPRVKAGDLVEPGPGVSPPQLVNFSKPAYPPIARSMRVEGDVVVSVLVDENGQVQDARLTEPIARKVGINEAALSAARSAHYKPATKEGVRVKMWTRLRIPFKL
jgi:TonB family protein